MNNGTLSDVAELPGEDGRECSLDSTPAFPALLETAPAPPSWVEELMPGRQAERHETTDFGDTTVWVREVGEIALVSVISKDAKSLDPAPFEHATQAAYGLLLGQLERLEARYPVRIWNLIPGILGPLGDLPHRYMGFNAGRFNAYVRHYGSSSAFPAALPTASGTGHDGAHLVLHCLASNVSGTPIENPRQVPAYRYSARYGPRPPSFARATRWLRRDGSRCHLLVGGTASIRGEASRHLTDLEAQLEETLVNLEALVIAASRSEASSDITGEPMSELSAFRHLRVYHPRLADRPVLAERIEASFPALECLEWIRSDLCRPELLVEIEGLAEL